MQNFEVGAGLDDISVTSLTEHEALTVIATGRCSEAASNLETTPSVDLPTRSGIVSEKQTTVKKCVVDAAVDQRRRVVSALQCVCPGNIF